MSRYDGRMSRATRRPRDTNQLAKLIVDISTGAEQDHQPGDEGKDPVAVERGRLGGLKGGLARKKSLSKTRLKAIATRAAKARWKR